jgi:hypothetical protein
MYVAAANASFGGRGVVNETGNALNFKYWGMPSNETLSLKGNAAFVGVIYAPEAAFHLGGGGQDTLDFVGACVVGSVKMNGHYNFHYDEALKQIGPASGYVVDGWREVDPNSTLSHPAT